jgi:hypothetical protein
MVLKINNPVLESSPYTSIKDKEYYINLTNLKNINFSDGWGWFIDIESNFPGTSQIFNKYIKKTSNRINIPEKINEISSIRSYKSMNNLYDTPIILKKNEELIKFNKYKKMKYIFHSVCILGIIGLCYILHF